MPGWIGAILAFGALIGIMVVVHRIRRDRWIIRDQYHQPPPSAIAAQRAAQRGAELDQAKREWS